jgi:tRNA G10  N-methylase Trm11
MPSTLELLSKSDQNVNMDYAVKPQNLQLFPETSDCAHRPLAPYKIVHADCIEWMKAQPECSVHAIVTDPPYGLKEYTDHETAKLRNGNKGGIWRIPPSFDGSQRAPLPRFTVMSAKELAELEELFERFAAAAMHILAPGAHVMIATNPLLSHVVYLPMIRAGFEKRGEIIRLVQTLRGGDRPKSAEKEFPDVSVMAKSQWEPWGLFRKPCEGRVHENLRKYGTGGLRRISNELPFGDVVRSAPTRKEERAISNHPSLKPQALMRYLVRGSLPLGRGVILDPFMGGGSTIAAAAALGYESIGVERDAEFLRIAEAGIPGLSRLQG